MAQRNFIYPASAGASVSWSDTAAWTGLDTPDDSDDVLLAMSSVSIPGSDQTANTTTGFTSLTIDMSYLGEIGTIGNPPLVSQTYLQIESILSFIGRWAGGMPMPNGSPLLMIDFGSAIASTIHVENTAMAGKYSQYGIPPLLIKAANAASAFHMQSGRAAIAYFGGETAEFASVNVGVSNHANPFGRMIPPELTIGAGTTLPLLNVTSGKVKAYNTITDIAQFGGETEHYGTGNVTGVVTVYPGGTYTNRKTGGTIDEIHVLPGGSYDESLSPGGCTVSLLKYYDERNIKVSPTVTKTATTKLTRN
jgi:hypothetical protein